MKFRTLLLAFMLLTTATVSFAQTTKPVVPRHTLTVNMKIDDDVQTVIKTLCKQLSLTVIFDESVKDTKVHLEMSDVTIEEAIQVVLAQKSLRACWTGEKELLVYPDTEELRKRYDVYLQWKPDSK